MAALNMESKAWRKEWSTDGEQCRRWRTLAALKDNLNKIIIIIISKVSK